MLLERSRFETLMKGSMLVVVAQLLFSGNIACVGGDDTSLSTSSESEAAGSITLMDPNSDLVTQWEVFFIRLFGNSGESLSKQQVHSMLSAMSTLELTDEFKSARKNFKSREETFGEYEALERAMKGQKLTSNMDMSLSQTLLATFDISTNNCLEYKLVRSGGLVKMVKSETINRVLAENFTLQVAHCWSRLMDTLEQTSNWLGAKDLKPLDDVMIELGLPENEFVELAKANTQSYKNDELAYTQAIATYLRNRAISRYDATHERPNFSNQFMMSFKGSCSDLIVQLGHLIKRIMKWLSSLDLSHPAHDYIRVEHYKLINRFQICTRIQQISNLRMMVLDKLELYDFWVQFEDRQLFKKMRSYLKKPGDQLNIAQRFVSPMNIYHKTPQQPIAIEGNLSQRTSMLMKKPVESTPSQKQSGTRWNVNEPQADLASSNQVSQASENNWKPQLANVDPEYDPQLLYNNLITTYFPEFNENNVNQSQSLEKKVPIEAGQSNPTEQLKKVEEQIEPQKRQKRQKVASMESILSRSTRVKQPATINAPTPINRVHPDDHLHLQAAQASYSEMPNQNTITHQEQQQQQSMNIDYFGRQQQ